MRYALKAPVDGQVTLTSPIVVDLPDFRLEFLPDNGQLSHLRISVSVDASDFGTSIEFGSGDKPTLFEVKGDVEIDARMVEFLQRMESFLSFASAGAVRRIRWDVPKRERTPESDGEPGSLITSIKSEPVDLRPTVILDRDSAHDLAAAAEKNAELAIPMAFWREAMNEYFDRRFIQAFYNFYFVIEGFYANGKSSERAVLKAFERSLELRAAATQILAEAPRDRKGWRQIKRLFEEHDCPRNEAGILRLMVRLRGTLHHVSFRSTRAQPVPFEQDRFKHAAWLALGFASNAITRRCPKMPLVQLP